MTDTITGFYPRLASLPEMVNLMMVSFPENAQAILQAMNAGTDLECDEEELEELITECVLDQAVVVKSYKGLGVSDILASEAMAYFEARHSEVHHLLHAQAQELEKLLGKDGAALALGQARKPFTIQVLRWNRFYAVTAEDFENVWFDGEAEAIAFAQSNYEPFIQNAWGENKPANWS